MKQQPTLQTQRLILRPLNLTDAKQLQQLTGAYSIAATTLSIPHPYPDNLAQEWIERYQAEFEESTGVTFAIVIRSQAVLCGVILLKITPTHANAELGYWIGTSYWGQGYCTEAAIAIMKYGFLELELNRIYASHFKRNLASGRVMQKIGMKYEGCHRQHIKKWGEFEDLELYGILKSEWLNRRS